MLKAYEYLEKHGVKTNSIDAKRLSLFVANAMDRLPEYMALCCYFEVPCIQKLNFQEYDADKDVPNYIMFAESDFWLSNYKNLVDSGLAKLDRYVEWMTFNMKAIAPELEPLSALAIISNEEKIAGEFSRTVYYAMLILERKRSVLVQDGRAKYKEKSDTVIALEGETEAESELRRNYELERQLLEFDKTQYIYEYNDEELEEVADEWIVKDDERPGGHYILTEAEFILASAMYRMGLCPPCHIF